MKIKNDVIVISDDEDGDMGDIINSVISSKYYTVNDKGVVVIDDSENECPVLRQGNSQDGTNLLRVDANEESCSTNSPASSTGAVQAEENSLKRKINGNDEHEETEEGGSRIKRARKGRRRRGRGCGSPENLEVEASTSTACSSKHSDPTSTNASLSASSLSSPECQCSTSNCSKPHNNNTNEKTPHGKQQETVLNNSSTPTGKCLNLGSISEAGSTQSNCSTSNANNNVTADSLFCPICPNICFMGSKREQRFLRHYRKEHLIHCFYCTKCNSHYTDFKAHLMKTKHDIRCPLCNNSSREWELRQLAEHIKDQHPRYFNGKHFSCQDSHCSERAQTDAFHFICHYILAHTDFSPISGPHFTCNRCVDHHTHFLEKDSLLHYIREHRVVLTKSVFDLIKRRTLLLENIDWNQLPSFSHQDKSSSTLPNPLPNSSIAKGNPREALTDHQVSTLPTESFIKKLTTFSHILFIDLDNWGKFFNLPYPLSPRIFVWGFCGGRFVETRRCSVHFRALANENRFYQHPKCGLSKDAADFALCVQAGRLDLQLPVQISFTILSGDGGFNELQNQLRPSKREIHLVNPHNCELDMLYATLMSIGEK